MSLIIIDVETTGTDRSRDQVIELCIQNDLYGSQRTFRFRPTCPIHPEALATHGITADALASCPTFADNAASIRSLLDSTRIIVGYNVRFDLEMLQAELERAGLPLLDLTAKILIDPMRLWQHFEPRTLEAAHEKFLGRPIQNAHAASVDVSATGLVLEAMIERFGLVNQTWSAIAKLADPMPERHMWFGPSHHLKWQDGAVVIAFGKYAGHRIDQIDPGFLDWLMRNDFPRHVKEAAHQAGRASDFAAWARATHPPIEQ